MVRLTPKGMAMGAAVEAGFMSEPPTNEQMQRFQRFWETMEECVVPMAIARMKEAEASEAPASEMD